MLLLKIKKNNYKNLNIIIDIIYCIQDYNPSCVTYRIYF